MPVRLSRPPVPDRLPPARPLQVPEDWSVRGRLPVATPGIPQPTAEDLQSYSLITVDTTGMQAATQANQVSTVTHEVTGDHVTIAEVTGRKAIYLRVGARSNPWIRMVEGMEIFRYFRSLTFGVTGNVPSVPSFSARALCYASHGPLLLNPGRKEYGLNQPVFFRGTANTVWTKLWPSGLFPISTDRETLGKRGGSVTLFNLSLLSKLYFSWASQDAGTAFSADLGMPIHPQQHAVLPFDSPMEGKFESLVVAVPVGTVDYMAMKSSLDSDQFDYEQLSPGGLS